MIQLDNIEKSFDGKEIISDFSIHIKRNEFITITGESGSGKTTLLNIMGLLDKPDKGKVRLFDKENPNHRDIMNLRRNKIGYVFQNYVLMNNETVKKNLLVSKTLNKNISNQTIADILNAVGLDSTYLDKKIFQLSGGEQQRICIARIMLKPCELIFADEPTGNLDEENKRVILSLFKDLKRNGHTIVCVTHDKEIAQASDRIVNLSKL